MMEYMAAVLRLGHRRRFGLRCVLLGALSGVAVLSALCAIVPLPHAELLPNDASHVGLRTNRKAQEPRPFREYPGREYRNYPIPPDYKVPGEWVFARFMYRG